MTTHDQLLEDAKKSASALFSDMSVTQSTTKESLEELLEHIEVMIDSIENTEF